MYMYDSDVVLRKSAMHGHDLQSVASPVEIDRLRIFIVWCLSTVYIDRWSFNRCNTSESISPPFIVRQGTILRTVSRFYGSGSMYTQGECITAVPY